MGAVIESAPLRGQQWPALDPFLFCVHHVDHFPRGDGRLGPDAPLAGRQIGSDFAGVDGWNMYHGDTVPGFPAHPHRGFETVTFVQRGLIDHADSMGATARYGGGDVQWLTAGRGIVHAEMFPLVHTEADNPTELFQIWLNLPAQSKMAAPHFSMLWDEQIPRVTVTDGAGRNVEVTVVAGALGDMEPPPPPPESWAGRPDADVAIWHLRLDDGASFELPAAASAATVRTLYVFRDDTVADTGGPAVSVDGEGVGADSVAVVQSDRAVTLSADGAARVLVLQGRPIGEPVARYGPFVMNTEDEIRRAFSDYRSTQFGGWPWGDDGPTNGVDAGRFALHADGRLDEPASAVAPDLS